jgi:hypothetical protein
VVKLLAILLLAGAAGAQAPDAQQNPDSQLPPEEHILGVVPNYNTVENPSVRIGPLAVKEKFKLAADDAFDPFSWVVTGLYAGAEQWNWQDREFGQGMAGYGERYAALFADQAISSYLSEAIVPALLHEDPRFFRRGMGSFWKRAGYAMSRVLVTRTDAGAWRFNTSEIAGNMLAASLGDLYHAPSERGAAEVMERFSLSVVSDAGFNVLKEFWPDMRHKLFNR